MLCVQVQKSVKAIMDAESAAYREEVAALATAWDGEKKFVSK